MFFKILGIIVFLLFIYVGYRYIKDGTKSQKESELNISLLEKRRKNAQECCPIKSAGTSMDSRKIYVLTLEELGIE